MNVTCTRCGWVHFAVTRKHAENEVAHFNDYFSKLSKENQMDYYGGEPSTITQYEACRCGSLEFRPSKPGDCPDGVTISPVIYETSPTTGDE